MRQMKFIPVFVLWKVNEEVFKKHERNQKKTNDIILSINNLKRGSLGTKIDQIKLDIATKTRNLC